MKYLDTNSPGSDTSPNGMRFTSSPTSASVASRLYTNGQRSSRRTSFSSEPELMNFSDNEVHSDFNDISSQVSMISKKLTDMQEIQMLTNEEKSRLKTENAVLQERVHILEEQFQVSEQRWKEKLEEEKSRAKDMLARVEREKHLEVESSSLKYQVLEKDLKTLKKDHESLQDEVSGLKRNQDELKYQLRESQNLCETLEKEKRKLKSEFERYKQDALLDQSHSSELLEELTRQTENLRNSQLPRQGSLADQMVNLEEEIENLRMENRELREQNEDLQAQILHDSVEKGRSLLADAPSLMDELNGMDTNELMNALKEQEICNQKLRDYINGILSRVIVMHPEILEIKDEELKERERQQAECSSTSEDNIKKTSSASHPDSPHTLQRGDAMRRSLQYSAQASVSFANRLYSYLPTVNFFKRQNPSQEGEEPPQLVSASAPVTARSSLNDQPIEESIKN